MKKIKEIPIYHVPASIEWKNFEKKRIETADTTFILTYPVLTSEQIKHIGEVVRSNRNDYLALLPVQQIIEKIDQAIQKWLNPAYPLRQLAEKLLPEITGYDKEMVRLELKRYMRTFRKKELLRFLDEELDQGALLDEFRPRKSGGMSRAFGPAAIFHVFSGNVPGVQIWSIIMGLILKSACLGKTSFSEPLLPALFVQSLAEVDKQLAEAMAILPWIGGSSSLEERAIERAEAIIVYGSNQTVETLREKVPTEKKFLHYGHKISFAMIGKEALTSDYYAETVHKLAEDVSVYDQQSCLSPQTIFVEEGGAITAKGFAQMLGAELANYHKKRPRAKLADEEAMSIQKIRNVHQLESLRNSETTVYESHSDTAWTVIFHKSPGFAGSPLNRTIHVFSCENLEHAAECIVPYQQYLQSCGLAVAPQRLFTLADLLGTIGINRICPIGEMNRAKPGWHHDGGFNLLDLVRMVDIERNVEDYIERFDPDVE
ncbi:acyl-CoA reductase [Niallia sp. NCCP-28]|uniref:acyl-CoA reductase n=1 Tax=Niallia sp. NCCP-28 TaxID=2934712 RepID=UPI002086F2E8|nr:acyl-CoA reductase [Niallia sp. NCCP-28]GKU83105.1 acyl-CoA reductase [Niallia sp. NCCP-28]